MPHNGQLVAVGASTSGCIGQVYAAAIARETNADASAQKRSEQGLAVVVPRQRWGLQAPGLADPGGAQWGQIRRRKVAGDSGQVHGDWLEGAKQMVPTFDRVHPHEAVQRGGTPAGVGLAHNGPTQRFVATDAHVDACRHFLQVLSLINQLLHLSLRQKVNLELYNHLLQLLVLVLLLLSC